MNCYFFNNESLSLCPVQVKTYNFQVPIQQQMLLRALAHALSQSLKTYNDCLQEIELSPTQIQNPTNQAIAIEDECVYIMLEQNQVIRKSQIQAYITDKKTSSVEKHLNSPKSTSMATLSLLEKHQLINRATSDELPLEQLKAIIKQPRKIKVNKTIQKQSKKRAFEVKVPQVDLINTCNIQKFNIDRDELAMKKSELLKRKINSWPVVPCNVKHKRELKNLDF